MIAIEIPVEIGTPQSDKVRQAMAKAPLGPPVGVHPRGIHQAEQSLEIQVHHLTRDAEMMQCPGESRKARGWFGRLDDRWVEQEYMRLGNWGHDRSSIAIQTVLPLSPDRLSALG